MNSWTSTYPALSTESGRTGRGGRSIRRFIVVWLVAGLLAAAGSTAWASGFAVSNAEIGQSSPSEPVRASVGSTSAAPQWVDAAGGTLTLDFQGVWVVIEEDATLFEVDLSEADPAHSYQIGVYQTADLDDSGWTDLQLNLVMADGPCTTADLSNPIEAEALNLLAAIDAAWVVQLDGGDVVCVGVPAIARAHDTEGTFARKVDSTASPTPPAFTASANRIQ